VRIQRIDFTGGYDCVYTQAFVTTDMNARAWNHACIRAIGATDESILAVAAHGSSNSTVVALPVFLPDVTGSGRSGACMRQDSEFVRITMCDRIVTVRKEVNGWG